MIPGYYFRVHNTREWFLLVVKVPQTWAYIRAVLCSHFQRSQLHFTHSGGQLRYNLIGQKGEEWTRDGDCLSDEDVIPLETRLVVATEASRYLHDRYPYTDFLTQDERLYEEIVVRSIRRSIPILENPHSLKTILRYRIEPQILHAVRSFPRLKREQEYWPQIVQQHPVLRAHWLVTVKDVLDADHVWDAVDHILADLPDSPDFWDAVDHLLQVSFKRFSGNFPTFFQMTLYIYSARPKERRLDIYRYVGYANTNTSSGPSHAFSRVLHQLRNSRHITARRVVKEAPALHDWSIEVLEVDEDFSGHRGCMEERRGFYMYWMRHEHECILLNQRQVFAMEPRWKRTWSVLDNSLPL